MSVTKRPSLRLTQSSDQIIEADQYNNKLQKLLNKIQTQNRYSNRITITNVLNLNRFEAVKRELDQMKQMKKMEELNEIQLKNINMDLSKQIKQLKEQLELTSVSLLAAKKQIKLQAVKLKVLEQQNIELQQQLLAKKREDVEIITNFKMSIVSNLLESQVKQFLSRVQWRESPLIEHCRQCVINEDYNDFFMKLEHKVLEFKKEQKYNSARFRLSPTNSRKRFNPSISKQTNRTVIKPESKQKQTKIHRRVKTHLPLLAAAVI